MDASQMLFQSSLAEAAKPNAGIDQDVQIDEDVLACLIEGPDPPLSSHAASFDNSSPQRMIQKEEIPILPSTAMIPSQPESFVNMQVVLMDPMSGQLVPMNSFFGADLSPLSFTRNVPAENAQKIAPRIDVSSPEAIKSTSALSYVSESSIDGSENMSQGHRSPRSKATVEDSLSSYVFDPSLPPLKALSAYNFFFRDERDRILHGGGLDFSEEHQSKLLLDHWQRDRTKKRPHRKTHGKIDFTTLSRLISSRWKSLTDEGKGFYRRVAAKDWERYQHESGSLKIAA